MFTLYCTTKIAKNIKYLKTFSISVSLFRLFTKAKTRLAYAWVNVLSKGFSCKGKEIEMFSQGYTLSRERIGCSFMYSGFGSYSIFYFYSPFSLLYSFENCSRWIYKLKLLHLIINVMFSVIRQHTSMLTQYTYLYSNIKYILNIYKYNQIYLYKM